MNLRPLCRTVRLICREPPDLLPMWIEVYPGMSIGGCRVGYCNPPRCVMAPMTEVSCEPWVEHRVRELENNMLVELLFERSREVYIYPKKVWNEVKNRLLEPMSRGQPPREQGAILCGPPGTGKTSMAQIISTILGLYVVSIDPQKVLSKWVGETERKMDELLQEAERNEPSVVLLDDAEWCVRSRELQRGEDSPVYLGMMNILLRRLQAWSRARKLTIALVTTNVSVDLIDVALRRSGRLGRPIFVPLPDFEAVYTLLREYGVEDRLAERLAIEIVNAGLPMSDAVSIAKRVLEGEDVRVEPIKARGYVRSIPPPLERRHLEILRKHFDWMCRVMVKGAKIWLTMRNTVSIPVALTILGLVCRKPTVVVTDPRHLDEAVSTADTCDAALIVPTEVIPREAQRAVLGMSDVPTVFCGSEPPAIYAIPIRGEVVLRGEARHVMAYATMLYYGADREEAWEEAQKLRGAMESRVESFLHTFALTRDLQIARRFMSLR